MTRDNGVQMPEPLRSSLQDEPPEKRRRFESLWRRLSDARYDESVAPSTDAAWEQLSAQLDHDGAARAEEPHKHQASSPASLRPVRRRRSDRAGRRSPVTNRSHRDAGIGRGVRIAVGSAIIALLVVSATLLLNRPSTVEAAAGEQRTVELSDGSIVELNSDSQIVIAGALRRSILPTVNERRVSLEGEAYFSVASSDRPFVVEAGEARIRVTGTEFNVHARGNGLHGTRITLVSGSVEVAAHTRAVEPVLLTTPGTVATVTSSTQIAILDNQPAIDRVLAWRRRAFAFTDTPISIILDEIERRFDLEIAPRSGVTLDEPMNLFYSRGVSPEEILNDICFEQNCKYRPTSRGFALVPAEAEPGRLP